MWKSGEILYGQTRHCGETLWFHTPLFIMLMIVKKKTNNKYIKCDDMLSDEVI